MEQLRFGFTTGSCAAAAAKAAAYMLLTGKIKEKITIETPKHIVFEPQIHDILREENCVSCSVIKDGGDDPDVTTGAHICATVCYAQPPEHCADAQKRDSLILIDGGIGVGRVTKPGLDQPVGNAAINRVPREMIDREVREVCRLCDFKGALSVVISIPEGEALAGHTFNPRLGIVGGISVLGTSGVVEPMSTQALLDTIAVELRQKRAQGYVLAAVSPGNYGLDFMRNAYGYDLDKSVKCSNFIGDTIDMCIRLGFSKMLLTGHIGKLIKLSGGIMNTHSKEGDCRMELMAAAVLRAGGSRDCALQILQSVATEEGVRILEEAGTLEAAMKAVMEQAMFYLNRRAAGKLQIECMMYDNRYGLLAQSAGAEEFLEELSAFEYEGKDS